MSERILISREDLKELKRLHENTPPEGVFIFKEKEWLKEYAGYVIEYLEQVFGGEQ